MIEDDPQRWSGDTPTPSASTSGSSVSTLAVDETAFLSKCDVGEAFELTYWSAIRKYWKQDLDDDCTLQDEPKNGANEVEELPLDVFELVDVSLGDDSDLKSDRVVLQVGITKRICRWWGSNVSMIIPDGQEVRDHFCMSSCRLFKEQIELLLTLSLGNAPALEKTYLAYFRTAMSLAMSSAMLSQFYIFTPATLDPHPLDFRDVGKPLACASLGIAIVVNIIGAVRFHRAQGALLNGEALIGGPDLMLVGALVGMVSILKSPYSISYVY